MEEDKDYKVAEDFFKSVSRQCMIDKLVYGSEEIPHNHMLNYEKTERESFREQRDLYLEMVNAMRCDSFSSELLDRRNFEYTLLRMIIKDILQNGAIRIPRILDTIRCIGEKNKDEIVIKMYNDLKNQ